MFNEDKLERKGEHISGDGFSFKRRQDPRAIRYHT